MNAIHAQVVTAVCLALSAGSATSAGKIGHQDNLVAFREPASPPGTDDPSADLMPKDAGIGKECVLAPVGVIIGTANADRDWLDKHPARGNLRRRDIV